MVEKLFRVPVDGCCLFGNSDVGLGGKGHLHGWLLAMHALLLLTWSLVSA